MRQRWLVLLAVLGLSCLVLAQLPLGILARSAPGAAPSTKRSSSAIAITAGGETLLVVNPDSNSLTLVDTATQSAIAEIAVGGDPRTVAVDDAGQRAYVANYGSQSVSAVDLAARAVVRQIAVGHQPYGIVVSPAGDRLYVAEQGADQVRVLDTSTFATLAVLPTRDRPSGLAISADGSRLYVTHLLASAITVIDLEPYCIQLPLIHAGLASPSVPPLSEVQGRTGHARQPQSPRPSGARVRPVLSAVEGVRGGLATWQAYRRAGVGLAGVRQALNGERFTLTPALSLAGRESLSAPEPAVGGWGVASTIQLWPDSNLVQAIVLSPDGRRAYLPHTRSNTANRALTFDTAVFPLVSLVDLQTGQHLVGQQLDLGTLDPPGVGLPFDAALTPEGQELWVVNAASNNVSVLDLARRRLVRRIPVGDNPRGIVMAPGGRAAYVDNTLAGTVSVLDTARYTVTATIPVTRIPLPPALLRGKRLFHSSARPDLARAGWISCNTCHFEGTQDGRTWTFGFSGPRNTTSLLGMVETYPLRWSGEWNESADCEFAVRKENFGTGLIAGEMNCSLSPLDCVNQAPNQGRSYDLDCLALFIDSLRAPLSPAHAQREPLSEAERRGLLIFNRPELRCVACHPAPLYTDLQKHDVGTATADERVGPAFDTPSLRGLYDSAPYFHDGSAATLRDALTRASPGREHDVRGQLSEAEIQDLLAFLWALPFE